MNENVIESLLVTLRGRVKEGRRFLNEEKDPTTSKELNEEPYEVKILCTIFLSGSKGGLSDNFSIISPKKSNSALHEVARVHLTFRFKLDLRAVFLP